MDLYIWKVQTTKTGSLTVNTIMMMMIEIMMMTELTMMGMMSEMTTVMITAKQIIMICAIIWLSGCREGKLKTSVTYLY